MNKYLNLLIILLLSAFLSNCGFLGPAEDPLNENSREIAKHGKVREKMDLSLGQLFGIDDNVTFKDNIVWNVALDKVSFMPLQTVDKSSGIITTEWYQVSDDTNNRIKIVIKVTGDVAEDASLAVQVFKETFDGSKWTSVGNNEDLALKIKNSILDQSLKLQVAKEIS
jgi:hypothetical protein